MMCRKHRCAALCHPWCSRSIMHHSSDYPRLLHRFYCTGRQERSQWQRHRKALRDNHITANGLLPRTSRHIVEEIRSSSRNAATPHGATAVYMQQVMTSQGKHKSTPVFQAHEGIGSHRCQRLLSPGFRSFLLAAHGMDAE